MSATLFVQVTRFRMRAVKLCEPGVKNPLGRLVLLDYGAEIAIEMSYRLGQRAVPAPYALPAGFAMFLAVGTVAAASLAGGPIAAIAAATGAVVLGTFAATRNRKPNPRREAPVLNARIRKRWRDSNLKIGVIGEKADLTYDYAYLGAGPETLAEYVTHEPAKLERQIWLVGQGAAERSC